MRALHYGQPDRRHLEPGDHSCHFCNANDTRSRLLDVEGASYQGYFAATPVKIMGQIGPDPFMWVQVIYRIGDSMTVEIPTNGMFQKEGQVPLDVLSVDLPLFHSQATPTVMQRRTAFEDRRLRALPKSRDCL
jgi:hypothetical protein